MFADAAGAYHLCDASVSEDVACVDEAVQHLSCLLDQVTLVGIVLQLLICTQKETESSVGAQHSSDSLQRCKTVLAKISKKRTGNTENTTED